jgi:hypothetical protein
MVAGEIDVCPARRGKMRKHMVRDVFSLTRDSDGTFEIPGIPKNDRGKLGSPDDLFKTAR